MKGHVANRTGGKENAARERDQYGDHKNPVDAGFSVNPHQSFYNTFDS